jgi:hypothetical protein
MKKSILLAVAVLFCAVSFSFADSPTVGTKEWRDAVKASQDLNANGEYQKAVDTAVLSYQKAWYQLSVLRTLMGGKRDDNKHWGSYNVEYQTDPKEAKFAGTAEQRTACLNQVKAIRETLKTVEAEGYSDRVSGIEEYLQKYEKGLLR